MLEVSASGYHAWLRRVPPERARARERLKLATPAAHARTRLQRELAADGFAASLGTIKRVRRGLGLCCIRRQRRSRVATTDSRHSLAVAPNLLAQDFRVARPDQVWTADITHVPTVEGWLYVAAIKDRSRAGIRCQESCASSLE